MSRGPVRYARALVALAALGVLAGCATTLSVAGRTARANAAFGGTSILRIASTDDPDQFSARLGDRRPAISALVNAFLVREDETSVPRPFLLEKLPRQDDGTWVLRPNGTMVTTLVLRAGLLWQDGYPITAQDIEFAFRVYSDASLPLDSNPMERHLSGVRVLDERTAELTWKGPFFGAGWPREEDLAPLPSHLVEELYARDRRAFMNSGFWSSPDYVGAGPYRLVERDPGQKLTLVANPYFHFGKPAIEVVEVYVVPDKQAIVKRLLSAALDFAEYPDILELQAGALRDAWKRTGGGAVLTAQYGDREFQFQHRAVANHQAAVKDVRVRQALMHAIDREMLAAAETRGLSSAADSSYTPDHRLWPRIDPAIAKYPYSPPRASALLAEAGWTRGTDGLQRDGRGLLFDLQIVVAPEYPREAGLIAQEWKRVGIVARAVVMSEGVKEDSEYRASFPGVLVTSAKWADYTAFMVDQLPTTENRFQGRNRGSYGSREVEDLARRWLASIQVAERDDLSVALERAISVDVAVGRLYYQVRPAAAREPVRGVKGLSKGSGPTYLSNIWEWSLA